MCIHVNIFQQSYHCKRLASIGIGTAAAPRATAATPATTSTLRCTLVLVGWGRANKSIVDCESLIEQFRTVEVLDGLAGFGEGCVFDQGISLAQIC